MTQATLFDLDQSTPADMKVLRGRLNRTEQKQLIEAALAIAADAPFYHPTMRDGTPFRVQITSAGATGWTADRFGYRYTQTHPETKRAWPPIPGCISSLAQACASEAGFDGFTPDSCLVNLYKNGSKLGLHRDNDELDKTAPIVSVSLGDECVFKFGTDSKTGPYKRWRLVSGDVVVFGGSARLCWHGVDKITPGTSDLFAGRLNLTIRKAL